MSKDLTYFLFSLSVTVWVGLCVYGFLINYHLYDLGIIIDRRWSVGLGLVALIDIPIMCWLGRKLDIIRIELHRKKNKGGSNG